MQKPTPYFILFFIILIFTTPLTAQVNNGSILISGSWHVVDIQAKDGIKLSDDELSILGNTWHFVSNDSLIIENYDGIFAIDFQQKGNQLSYMGQTVSIEKKEAYQIDLLDTYNSRNVAISFRIGEPLKEEDKAFVIDQKVLLSDINVSKYGFDFSFEEKEEEEAPPPPDQLYKEVGEMPRFPGCEDKNTVSERKTCASRELLKFIYTNLKYPADARAHKIEGTAVVTFVVEKDGSVSGARIVREIGDGCAEEALRVVNLINERNIRWIPGKQEGLPVRVQFNLPVKFTIN